MTVAWKIKMYETIIHDIITKNIQIFYLFTIFRRCTNSYFQTCSSLTHHISMKKQSSSVLIVQPHHRAERGCCSWNHQHARMGKIFKMKT